MNELKENCENGRVFKSLDGVKIGDVFAYRLHDRFTDLCGKFVITYLYKRMGHSLACVCYRDGYFDYSSPANILKNDFFIENVGEDWTKAVTQNRLEQVEIRKANQ